MCGPGRGRLRGSNIRKSSDDQPGNTRTIGRSCVRSTCGHRSPTGPNIWMSVERAHDDRIGDVWRSSEIDVCLSSRSRAPCGQVSGYEVHVNPSSLFMDSGRWWCTRRRITWANGISRIVRRQRYGRVGGRECRLHFRADGGVSEHGAGSGRRSSEQFHNLREIIRRQNALHVP